MRIDRRDLVGGMALGALAAFVAAPGLARGPAAYPAPDRELMVPVAGGRLYVRVNGDLTGPQPPIVCIHGGPGGSHAALLDALSLADQRPVILYDQLDSGRSDQPGDRARWTVPRFVDELDAVRTALGVERWHVLGHSWGGTIALEYGARRPAALRGLVLAGPLVSTRSWIADADTLRRTLPARVATEITRCETLGVVTPPPSCVNATEAFYAAFNRRESRSDGMLAYVQAMPDKGFNHELYRTMWGSSEFVATGTLRAYDGETLLTRLNGPRTLFIAGQHDEARPATVEGFARRVPGSEFAVIPGAAHGMFGDRPAETVGTLRGWLARQDQMI